MGCRKEVTAAIQTSNESSLEVGVKKVVRAGRRLEVSKGVGLGIVARLGAGMALEFLAWVVE